MEPWETRHATAERHVAEGRRAIERQRELIARQSALGQDVRVSEALLATFERSQAIFEANLQRILRERE
jgi:hypothetical protein